MKTLFDSTNIFNGNMKNRLFRSATHEELANEKGHMTEKLFKKYEELATGGVGTIVTGYAFVREDEQPSPGMMGIYNDSFVEEYKQLTDMVHKQNTNIVMQR